MKLLYCTKCNDIKKLQYETTTCHCGESSGHYQQDGVHAVISGPCVALGLLNMDVLIATGLHKYHPDETHPIKCFTIPETSPHTRRVK